MTLRISVPEGWGEAPLKDVVTFSTDNLHENTSPGFSFRYVDIGSVEHGSGITKYQEMSFSEAPSRARKRVKRGDTIVSTVRTYLKAIAYIDDDEDLIVSTGFSVLRPKTMLPRYFTYLMESDLVCNEIDRLSWGVSYPAVSESLMGSIHVPIPPLSEQEHITEKLDNELGTIDEVVCILTQQTQIIEAYRASIIHETVTRGLDSSVPIKRINTDWLEGIPASWDFMSFKRVASVSSNLVDPSTYSNMIEIDPDNIEGGTGKLVDVKTVGEVGAISAKQLFSKGQIIYSKIRPELNKVVIAPTDGLCSADMYPITTSQCVRWLSYVMRSDLFVRQTALISYRVAMPKVNAEQLAAIKIPVPPFQDQERIASYLDSRCASIDAVIDTKRKQLDVLKKRRQSLIYEYVTGKRRVSKEG